MQKCQKKRAALLFTPRKAARHIEARPESVLHELLDRTKLENVLRGENVTWFGQLMSRPQLIAWLYQVDVWFDEYNIDLAL